MIYGLAVSKAVVRLYFHLHFAHYFLSSSHTINAASDTVLHYNPFPWRLFIIITSHHIAFCSIWKIFAENFLCNVSTAGDALILTSTVLFTELLKLKSKIISENIFSHGLFNST